MTPLRLALLLVTAALVASCGGAHKKCSPDSCDGCCDADGECQPGTLFNACGTRGAECTECTLGATCQVGICFSPGGSGGGFGGAGGGSGATGGGTGGGVGWTGGGSGGDAGTSCISIAGTRQQQVCSAWKCARAAMNEGSWNGNAATCNAGELNDTGRNNSLQLLNVYRSIAQLPVVTLEATRTQKAQACAVMMDAANALSHTPDAGWPCYTPDGAEAAGKSNISTGQAVRSIDMYMSDYGAGNAATLGHRRWLLSNGLGPVGIGGTTDGSCHWVIGGTGNANKPWMSWPPPGPVPVDAIAIPGLESVDSTGWSVQSDSINLSGAQVTVTDTGSDAGLDVTVTQLGQYYGSTYALRFNPQGWTSTAGHTYRVQLSNIATPISYEVQVVSCP